MFTEIWDTVLKSNLFNFVVLVVILTFVAIKFDLKSMIASMQDKVAQTINDVKQKKADSETALNDAIKSVKNLASDVEQIERDAKKSADSIYKKIVDEAQAQADNIYFGADKVISAEEKQIVADLVKTISQASVAKSKENVQNMLENNIELHEKYINESIDKLDGLKF
ncbi:ATP synthase F0 subunit B [bacterium]|nr:ATP synthase F0 subunit B [bacterium]